MCFGFTASWTMELKIWYNKIYIVLFIATHYGLEVLGIEYQWGWDFPHPFRLVQGVVLVTHFYLVLRLSISTTTPVMCQPWLVIGQPLPDHCVQWSMVGFLLLLQHIRLNHPHITFKNNCILLLQSPGPLFDYWIDMAIEWMALSLLCSLTSADIDGVILSQGYDVAQKWITFIVVSFRVHSSSVCVCVCVLLFTL